MNIYSLPYCSCLPLYCLNNFKKLKNIHFKFSDYYINDKINLLNKYKNILNYYSNDNKKIYKDKFIFTLIKKK